MEIGITRFNGQPIITDSQWSGINIFNRVENSIYLKFKGLLIIYISYLGSKSHSLIFYDRFSQSIEINHVEFSFDKIKEPQKCSCQLSAATAMATIYAWTYFFIPRQIYLYKADETVTHFLKLSWVVVLGTARGGDHVLWTGTFQFTHCAAVNRGGFGPVATWGLTTIANNQWEMRSF